MRCVALATGVIVALAATAAGDPKAGDPKPDKARADKLFDDGRKYLTAKEYALACTAFEQSQASDPAIGTQLNIALCYEQWGHVAAAYRAYLEAERLATAKKDDRAKGAHKKVDELGPQVPHLTLVLPTDVGPSAIVLVDGQEIPHDRLEDQLVEIGEHKIEGRMPGQLPKLSTVELKSGQHERVVIELRPSAAVAEQTRVTQPPPAPAPARDHAKLYGGIALAGTGAVLLGVSALVGLSARSDYSNAIGMCPMLQCTTESAYQATQDARNRAGKMTFVAGGGGALAAAGVVLIVLSGGHAATATEPKTAIAPMVAPGVVGVAIGGQL